MTDKGLVYYVTYIDEKERKDKKLAIFAKNKADYQSQLRQFEEEDFDGAPLKIKHVAELTPEEYMRLRP